MMRIYNGLNTLYWWTYERWHHYAMDSRI